MGTFHNHSLSSVSHKNERIQILRAIAIIGVVMIHTLPSGFDQVLIRPFINFCVALFIFLSGYLTQFGSESVVSLYKKRLIRVCIPYVIWTLLYTVAHHGALFLFIKNLCSGHAAAQMYFIPVYMQLVLLTPLIQYMAKSKYWMLGFFVSPIFVIAFVYLPTLMGISLNPYVNVFWGISCAGWFIFYYLGLLLGNGYVKINVSTQELIIAYVLSILVQIGEGYIFYLLGNVNCGTQLKLSSFLTSIIFALISCLYARDAMFIPKNKVNCLMISLGNCSFGIYLSHIFIMGLLSHFFSIYNVFPFGVNSCIVIIVSWICVLMGRKILGKKYGRYVGVY